MGEVYPAEDTKLGRQVAINILLESLTDSPSRPNWSPIFEISSGT